MLHRLLTFCPMALLNILSQFFPGRPSTPPSVVAVPDDCDPHFPSAGSDGSYPILPADSLLTLAQCNLPLLRELTGFSRHQFDNLCLDSLRRFANAVQLAPASEAHHHSYPVGLLHHTLEVLEISLSLRRQHILPEGAPPEKSKRSTPRWTYAVFVATLLHDIGKVLVDQEFTLIFPDGRRQQWAPLGTPIAATGAERYILSFVANRQYRQHQSLGLSMLGTLVPDEGRTWLSEEPDILVALEGICNNKPSAGIVGKILREADTRSAGSSIGSTLTPNSPQQIPSATESPIHERIVMGIRQMVLDRIVSTNQTGSCVFHSEGFLWIVVPEFVNRLRDHLASQSVKIPPKNVPIYDILTGSGIAVPSSETRSVHKDMFVRGKDFEVKLSLLKLDNAKVFPGGAMENLPGKGAGIVVFPASAKREEVRVGEDSLTNQPVRTIVKNTFNDPPPAMPDPQSEIAADGGGTAVTLAKAPSPQPGMTGAKRNEVRRGHLPQGVSDLSEMVALDDQTADFLNWLIESLTSKTIKFNAPGGLVHFVDDGRMFLVSPAVFRHFSEQAGLKEEEWKAVQKSLRKSGICHRDKKRGSNGNLHQYRVNIEAQTGPKSFVPTLNGMIIERRYVEAMLNPVPHDNLALVKVNAATNGEIK